MKILKKLALVPMAVLLVFGLSACSGGSVAATVNGENIPEADVTSYIQSIRTEYGMSDDSDWASYLSSAGITAEEVREQVIDMLAEEKVVVQAAKNAGITVDDSEVDTMIDNLKSQYGTDEAYQSFLDEIGYTEDQVRDSYTSYLYSQKAEEQLITVTPTDEEIQAAIDENISTYNGAKRSSQILFSSDDEATAQEVLQQLKDGADFATLAQQYSQDSSASSGGDVGWDKTTTFVDAYQTALDGLSKGEMTQDLVQSSYGYHIILCTDEFSYNDGDTLTKDTIPSGIYDTIYNNLVSSMTSSAYSEWVSQLYSDADIVINNMPSGLPYDVSVTTATTSATTSTTTSATTATTSSTTSTQ